MRRLEDWPLRLDAALMAARERAFKPGDWDCSLFAADVVDAMCGTAIAARFRGRYKTARGARGVLRRAGGIDAIMAGVGPEIRPLMAQRGDVVELPLDRFPELAEAWEIMLGICIGERVAVATLPRGLREMPLRLATRAWRIGGAA